MGLAERPVSTNVVDAPQETSDRQQRTFSTVYYRLSQRRNFFPNDYFPFDSRPCRCCPLG